MNNILFQGIYSAIFSIYDEMLNVKKDSVQKLVDHNVTNGIKGFYVGGNTGECTVLPNRTRKQMLEAVKEAITGDTQVIAHVGSGHLEDVEDLIAHANSVGVDAISSLPPSLTPYYSTEEIITYYKHIAALSDAPVLAYVTPVLTGDPTTFAKRIMEIDNVIGIKLTIPNYYIFEKIKLVNNGNINLLNGPDESMLSGLVTGADGAIGTTYNLIPKVACKIYDYFKNDDMENALIYQHKMNRIIDVLVGRNLAGWKAPLSLLDIDPGYTVAPAQMPTENEVKDIIAKLEVAGITELLS